MLEVIRTLAIDDFITDNTRTLIIVLLVCVLLVLVSRRPGDVPPGPSFTLPVLGDFLRMRGNPLERFREMRKNYGDVFSFYLGSRLVVVLNGFDVIKKALVANGNVFSDRPHMFLIDEICEGKGIVATSGSVWKEQRQFAQTTIRMLASGAPSIENSIQEEATQLIHAFEEQIAKSNDQTATFDPHGLFVQAVSNIMCMLCFGKRYRYDDPQFTAYLHAIDESFKSFHAAQVLNFFPFLKHVPGDLFCYKQTMSHKHFVERHFLQQNITDMTSAIDDCDVNNFTSAYLHAMQKARDEKRASSMDEVNLKQSLGNIFSGGTESTTGTLCWALLYFMEYPDVQERCFQELRENVGLNTQPTMKHKNKCPFLSATIMEILRHADVTPLALAHTVPDDVVFMGYRIPKDCIVLPNLDSVLRDEATWKDPELFRPERFLDESGKVLKPEEYIPFSMGRRICLGETIAKMELFLFLSSLLLRFRFARPSADPVCFEAVMGLARVPTPFKVKVIRREHVSA